MRRLKTEVVIIGNGSAAMFAANKLLTQGTTVTLINPASEFFLDELRPFHGLGLWNAAYRDETNNSSLPDLYDLLCSRVKEVFPAPLEAAQISKGEHWGILSRTPIHRRATENMEREYFKLERKSWSAGQFRLVNPDHVDVRIRQLGVELPRVAQADGAIVRSYAISWNPIEINHHLVQFIRNKLENPQSGTNSACFVGARIEGRYGRKLVLQTKESEELSVEAERAILIFFSGDLLPYIKTIVAACEEPWIQKVRKRRREQHFIWLERNPKIELSRDSLWMALGDIQYFWNLSPSDKDQGIASWSTQKGPDGFEKVVDEGLRLMHLKKTQTKYIKNTRSFHLEWEWKAPQWKETSHQTFWATGYEGDLWDTMEVVWNLPLR